MKKKADAKWRQDHENGERDQENDARAWISGAGACYLVAHSGDAAVGGDGNARPQIIRKHTGASVILKEGEISVLKAGARRELVHHVQKKIRRKVQANGFAHNPAVLQFGQA